MTPAPLARTSVARLRAVNAAWELDVPAPVTLERYGRFKYGDTSHVVVFAEALAAACAAALPAIDAPLYMTTSGYGTVPPAAAALVEPTVQALRRRGFRPATFGVHRTSVTPADYATLAVHDRRAALRAEQLSARLPRGLPAGATVLALDDVVVTGVHEEALECALRREGAGHVLHAYLVDASAAAASPAVEAWLNGAIGSSPTDLVSLARGTAFVPNSRFLKAVLRLPAAQRDDVLVRLPPRVVRWMAEGARGDHLETIPDLAEGAVALAALGLPH